MADGEVTVSNVDKPLLEEVNGGDDLTETEQCVALTESKVLNEASTESPGILDASTAETKMKMEAEGGEDAVVDTIDSRNEAGAGEETVVHTIDSRNDAGAREETVVDTIDSRNEAGGGEKTVVGMSDSLKEPGVVEETVDTSDSRKETGAGEETVVDTSDSRKEAGGGEKTVLDTSDSREEAGVDGEETVACTSDSHNEAGGGEETVVDMNNSHVAEMAPVLTSDLEMEAEANEQTEMAAVKELEPDEGYGTPVVDMGHSHTEMVAKAAPVLELVQLDIKPGLDIEFEAPIAVAVTDSSQLGGHHSEAVDAMGAEIPTGEANRESETDGDSATKAEDDEAASIPTLEANREFGIDGENTTKVEEDAAASIPTSEANREMETDGQDTMKAEDNDTNSISTNEANREMETDKMDITKAEDGEASSIPTGEANRKLETDKKDITKAEDGEAVSIPTGESNRELETDGDEVMKTEDDEAASVPTGEANRELETGGDDVMKAEDVEAASIPTGEANRELETDGDDVMKAEDVEAASISTEEANGELVAHGEDITKAEDGETASMLEDSQEDPQYGENEVMTAEETAAADTEVETETDAADSGRGAGGKRKRGKNSKSPASSKAATRTLSRKVTEEDVCFICFDGGDLVLCDRRGCPKAYHPSCVNRDEAFFRAKGRWNCGWHLCSICEKNAHYMCYTCTYSLCKGCIKSAVILCIRGNKGFCENCMRTVKLIESKQQGDKDAQIDFDDKSSWEYLFKDYYMDLKERLSLSSAEIAEAKSPWKGSDVSGNRKQQSEPQFDNNEGGSDSDNSGEKVEVSKLKRRKITKKSKPLLKEDGMASMSVIAGSEGASTPSNTEWASKELLDFVKHMKNGDTSVLSQFDVQDLLLKYIQMNKLRIPNKKSQIMCDSRLQSLFGKPRVGHFEMLKLLESHFLIKEDNQIDDAQGTVVDTEVEGDETRDTLVKEVKDKKRKRKKGHSRGPQSNLDDYAAIDMHNIGLIYLRRKLMEDLLEDVEKFQDKVVGTFVRIRISGNNQKQDLYRLVQVMGMSKASEPYKVGKRTTDILLEILNLNKTEVISIDTISNQDFTEDECKRLRQSIKCGLINRPTVGVILDKAMEIHEARVNDWLESEVLRLSHLRDRASEKGRRKELRECVEKLELLKTPEERQRRLDEIPEIHADPNMDPSYESDDDDSVTDESRRDTYMRSRDSSFSRRGREPISPRSSYSSKDPWGSGGKTPTRSWELDRNLSSKNTLVKAEDSTHNSEMVNENSWGLGRDRDQESKSLEKVNSTNSETIGRKGNSLSRPEMASGMASMTSTVTPTAQSSDTGIKINETEKIWHYKDPSGKIQGPFSMVQLRKWNNTGYFPANLRIWRSTEKQDDSILLTDALAGRFLKESSVTEHRNLAGGVLQNREAERLNLDQNCASHNSPSGLVLSRGGMISGEMSGVPKEKWDGNDSSNLPSPTPKQGNAVWTGDAVPVTAATSYPVDNGISEPSRLVLPASVSSLLASAVNASGHSLMRSENVSSNSGAGFSPMTNTANPQSSQLTAVNEPPPMIVHSQHATATQDANVHPVKSINNIQNPNLDPHALGVGQTLKAEPSISVPTPAQPQGYGNWGGITSAVQNLAASFSNTGALALPQSEFWRAQSQANQPNIQLPSVPSLPWGAGIPQNSPAPANLNAVWGTMQQGNPNMGWSGPAPGTMNMNWGAPVQTMAPPNPGWVMPPTGPMPGNMNPGWVAPTAGNPGVQGMAPGNPNPGWVAPTVSGPRDNGSQGGDTGFNDGRPWNRQSSFGSGGHGGGPRGGFVRSHVPCPYNKNGRCRKGARCDYLHIQ